MPRPPFTILETSLFLKLSIPMVKEGADICGESKKAKYTTHEPCQGVHNKQMPGEGKKEIR